MYEFQRISHKFSKFRPLSIKSTNILFYHSVANFRTTQSIFNARISIHSNRAQQPVLMASCRDIDGNVSSKPEAGFPQNVSHHGNATDVIIVNHFKIAPSHKKTCLWRLRTTKAQISMGFCRYTASHRVE